jgi:hypothetical protein
MNKKTGRNWLMATGIILSIFIALTCYAAYNHNGDTDSQHFRDVYPQVAGTKLDSCTTCHSGGSYVSGGKTTTLGSCQWCHYKTNYGADNTQYVNTLNSYGLNYYNQGRGTAAITAIQDIDSDGDGYPNKVEIAALRYPGDPNDNPTKVAAPSKVFTRAQLEAMPQHTEFLMMNASKSDDSYTQYSGVALENLIKPMMLNSATGITVYSPDGFATGHPFSPSSNPNVYHVFDTYPQGTFYYNERADIAKYPPDPPNYPTGGWCDYSSPSAAGRVDGSAISNPEGLKLMLAFKRDGEHLTPGVLNLQNKLDGEGPFRVVPPQKNPGPPDQRSSSVNQNVIWPYKNNADHNAGFSSRSVTIIKVEPLPAGTTDINTLEAGWPYIDEAKIVVYGAINPLDNVKEKLVQLLATVDAIPQTSFKSPWGKWTLKTQLQVIQSIIAKGDYAWAYHNLQQNVLGNMHGCPNSNYPNDWLKDCNNQTTVSWAVNEIAALLKILT